jgi:hypothetical protein
LCSVSGYRVGHRDHDEPALDEIGRDWATADGARRAQLLEAVASWQRSMAPDPASSTGAHTHFRVVEAAALRALDHQIPKRSGRCLRGESVHPAPAYISSQPAPGKNAKAGSLLSVRNAARVPSASGVNVSILKWHTTERAPTQVSVRTEYSWAPPADHHGALPPCSLLPTISDGCQPIPADRG